DFTVGRLNKLGVSRKASYSTRATSRTLSRWEAGALRLALRQTYYRVTHCIMLKEGCLVPGISPITSRVAPLVAWPGSCLAPL
ncbi:hypothetical protein HAX54_000714, partial [Datura stramonium]|nr:hypothetical protein [Datura stramonium]